MYALNPYGGHTYSRDAHLRWVLAVRNEYSAELCTAEKAEARLEPLESRRNCT